MVREIADLSLRIPAKRYDTFAFTRFHALCHSEEFKKNLNIVVFKN